MTDDLALPLAALQHERSPRPLPLFLELVRQVTTRDPALAAEALRGLRIYQRARREAAPRERRVAERFRGACLRDCGGEGSPIVLVPSLINPPHVLDLDAETSLADALAPEGRVLLLDWGAAADRSGLDVAGHVRALLVPLLRRLGEKPALVGYCLGGTMALAAAGPVPVRGVATLASPWHFSGYPSASREALLQLWAQARWAAQPLGMLPIEVLQSAFWSLDPHRLVAKYARLATLAPGCPEFDRFLSLEDWANGGEPLPLPAARELIEDLFGKDRTGLGAWPGGGLPGCPLLHAVAHADVIAPAETAAEGERIRCPSGHVGMVVGRGARQHLHGPLRQWLARLAPQR